MRDLIVVGGGLAGLTAAYRQRHRDVLLLEASDRIGGRLLSRDHDGLALNLGAHMFSGEGTPVGDLLGELGLTRQPISGRLIGITMNGGRVLTGGPELWPFLLPLSPLARLSFIQMGLRLRMGATGMARLMRRKCDGVNRAALGFEDHRSLNRYMGRLHPQVRLILSALTERSGGDLDTMSAGHAMRSFTNVWSDEAPGANLESGSSALPQALVAAINGSGVARIFTGAPVVSVAQSADHVVVTLKGGGQVKARHCILATPASITRQITADLPNETAKALEQIAYGPFLSIAVSTRETGRMPWHGIYAIATPGAKFSVTFNQATGLEESVRAGRGSLMLFCGGPRAGNLATLDDRALKDLAHQYLRDAFPAAVFAIEAVEIARWPFGAPVARPGRAVLQGALERPLGLLALAGDYMESPNMNSAINAADRAVVQLGLR